MKIILISGFFFLGGILLLNSGPQWLQALGALVGLYGFAVLCVEMYREMDRLFPRDGGHSPEERQEDEARRSRRGK